MQPAQRIRDEPRERPVSVRVLIADDFVLVRDGIELVLSSHPEIEVVGTAEDGHEAIWRARELAADVVVLDLRLSRNGGIEALDAFREQLPDVRVLVLTANENPDSLQAAVDAGAAGYLTKKTSEEKLCAAVLTVARGGRAVTPSLTHVLDGNGAGAVRRGASRSSLSSRQRAVVRWLSAGLTDTEIAERLFISTRTVQYEIREVKERTGLESRSQLARWAVISSLR
jgi:two-component system NarL family response regulator